MAKEKVTIVVPNEDEFKPAPILFGVVTGAGVPDFDNVKSKGKRGGMQYSVTLSLSKKANKQFRQEILDFWEDNKPKDGGDEPANFKNITRKDKENEGEFLLYAKTQTEFESKGKVVPNIVTIVNHEGTKLDPEEFGTMGKGSEGRVAVTLAVYGDDEDAGVSVFLSAVKLTKHVQFSGGNAASAFGVEEGEVEGKGGFKSEKKKEKKKPKPTDDDEDEEADDEEAEAPKKEKKKDKKKKKKKQVEDE